MNIKNLALLLETIRQAKVPYCRTRIQKMVFLGQKEENLPYTYKFKQHYYGPFSKELESSLMSLVANGALQEESIVYPFIGEYGPVVEYRYSLTPFGAELLKIYSKKLSDEEIQKIKSLTEKYDKLSFNELISYVYSRYVKK